MRKRPVMQEAQYRLGFRRRHEMTDEDDLNDGKHADNENHKSTSHCANCGSRGRDDGEQERQAVEGWSPRKQTDHERDPHGSICPCAFGTTAQPPNCRSASGRRVCDVAQR